MLKDLFIDEVSGALKSPGGGSTLKPDDKTEEDTQAVRKDSNGKLWTKPATVNCATPETYGGFKAHSTDGSYVGVPIEIDPSLGFAYAALNISEKTEADTNYTVEVKIDPVTKKLYIPAPTQY